MDDQVMNRGRNSMQKLFQRPSEVPLSVIVPIQILSMQICRRKSIGNHPQISFCLLTHEPYR